MSWGWAILIATGTVGIDAELSRLEGHAVEVSADRSSYQIVDVAGEGAPLVGVVERRGERLVLVIDGGGEVVLTGVLAVPRIAGPGYKVWVLGERSGGSLDVRRIGILAPPLKVVDHSPVAISSGAAFRRQSGHL